MGKENAVLLQMLEKQIAITNTMFQISEIQTRVLERVIELAESMQQEANL